MDYKKDIESVLNYLNNMGYTRDRIEEELGYSPNYIGQLLAKGGNKRFFAIITKFMEEKKGGGSLSIEEITSKLIRIEAHLIVSAGTQVEILAHLTDKSVPALLRQKANEIDTAEKELRAQHGEE